MGKSKTGRWMDPVGEGQVDKPKREGVERHMLGIAESDKWTKWVTIGRPNARPYRVALSLPAQVAQVVSDLSHLSDLDGGKVLGFDVADLAVAGLWASMPIKVMCRAFGPAYDAQVHRQVQAQVEAWEGRPQRALSLKAKLAAAEIELATLRALVNR